MPKVKYLSASVPASAQAAKLESRNNENDRIAGLEAQIAALNEQLTKQNRDNLDAEYNIDEDNLSESLLAKINDLADRVAALEAIVNPNP